MFCAIGFGASARFGTPRAIRRFLKNMKSCVYSLEIQRSFRPTKSSEIQFCFCANRINSGSSRFLQPPLPAPPHDFSWSGTEAGANLLTPFSPPSILHRIATICISMPRLQSAPPHYRRLRASCTDQSSDRQRVAKPNSENLKKAEIQYLCRLCDEHNLCYLCNIILNHTMSTSVPWSGDFTSPLLGLLATVKNENKITKTSRSVQQHTTAMWQCK